MAVPAEVWKAILSFLEVMRHCRAAVPDDIQSRIMQHYRALFCARICDMGIMSGRCRNQPANSQAFVDSACRPAPLSPCPASPDTFEWPHP